MDQSSNCKLQIANSANCRPGTKCRLKAGCKLTQTENDSCLNYLVQLMHLSMSSRRGGGWGKAGHRAKFWHFPKNCCQIPYPRAKMWGQYKWNSPPGKWFVVMGTNKYSNALPPVQSDRSKSHPMPRFPPTLDIDRCIILTQIQQVF